MEPSSGACRAHPGRRARRRRRARAAAVGAIARLPCFGPRVRGLSRRLQRRRHRARLFLPQDGSLPAVAWSSASPTAIIAPTGARSQRISRRSMDCFSSPASSAARRYIRASRPRLAPRRSRASPPRSMRTVRKVWRSSTRGGSSSTSTARSPRSPDFRAKKRAAKRSRVISRRDATSAFPPGPRAPFAPLANGAANCGFRARTTNRSSRTSASAGSMTAQAKPNM